MRLLLATANKDKIREIGEIVKGLPLKLISAYELDTVPHVVEDQPTLEGNAIKKAMQFAQASGLLSLADDTGLFVEALGENPGVHTARYAGEACSYADNRQKMLAELNGVKNRKAYFKTVVALALPDQVLGTAEGYVHGKITESERGSDGFGYDPIFQPDGYKKTFAEMNAEEKHKLSHRGLALKNILPLLKSYIGGKKNGQ